MASQFLKKNSRSSKLLFLVICSILFIVHISLSVAYANASSLAEVISKSITANLEQQARELESSLAKNREALNQSDIAEQRVSQSVARLQGKKVTPALIAGSRDELQETYRVLDEALFEIDALSSEDKNIYNQQLREKAARLISYRTSELFWLAHGVQKTSNDLLRLKNKVNATLQSKSGTPADDMQKQKLQQLSYDIKQYELQNQQALTALHTLLGMDQQSPARHILPGNSTQALPDIDIDLSLIDENILMRDQSSKAPKKGKVSEKAPLKDNNPKPVYEYLQSLTPTLDPSTPDNSDSTLNKWLSTSKYLSYDLYNSIDKLQRKMLLKQKPSEPIFRPAELPASKITRARLAWINYSDERQSHALQHCNQAIFEQLQIHRQQHVKTTQANRVDKLQASFQHLINRRDYDQSFAALFKKMLILRDSVYPARSMLNNQADNKAFIRDIELYLTQNRKDHIKQPYTCYQDESQVNAQQRKQRKLVAEKDSALQQVMELTAKVKGMEKVEADRKAAIKNARRSWINRQRSANFTLQLAMHRNPKTLQWLVKTHKLGNKAHIYPAFINGKTYYVLIYGSYKDRELAYVAQFDLPQSIQDKQKIVIRRFHEVQQEFMTGFAMTRLVK